MAESWIEYIVQVDYDIEKDETIWFNHLVSTDRVSAIREAQRQSRGIQPVRIIQIMNRVIWTREKGAILFT